MKIILSALTLFVLLNLSVPAQVNIKKIVNKSKKKTEKKTEQRIENKIDKAVDNALDQTENAIDNTAKGNQAEENKSESVHEDKNQNSKLNSESTVSETMLSWNKYDFIPGTEIIFEDDHQAEKNGEFPSKWDLVSGVIENANVNGENVIFIRQTGNYPNGMVPLIKNPSADYLPDEFTVEFDCYFEKGKYSSFTLQFYDAKSQKRLPKTFLDIYVNQMQFGRGIAEEQYPNTRFRNVDKEKPVWRHIAISFNKRALKAYMDDTRLINIPNLTDNPTGITISVNHATPAKNQFIKNIRIAKGAVSLYDKVMTDGKFITTGIKFDVNQAVIKPESMGIINVVLKMMQEHPELKFSVEGHTDSDGNEQANQSLSENRADAVRLMLVNLGISADRLVSKGWGESRPMTENTTSEGKAQNRRVEFIKIN
ncbi:MAG: OmpA family protein [Candidatus Delongbacteria bacterium]|nr:OmpA family protein [Candidatus Delongbacteria bacterium]